MTKIQLYPANRSNLAGVKEIGEMLESIHDGMADRDGVVFVLLDAPNTASWNRVFGAIDTYSEQTIKALSKLTGFSDWTFDLLSLLTDLKRRHEIEIHPIDVGDERREDLELLKESYEEEVALKARFDAAEGEERISIGRALMFARSTINGIREQAMLDNIRDLADSNKNTPMFVITDGEYAKFIQDSLRYDGYAAELAKPLDAELEQFLATKFVVLSEALGLPRIMERLNSEKANAEQPAKREVHTGKISLRSERTPEQNTNSAAQAEPRAGVPGEAHSNRKIPHKSRN